MFFFFPSRCEHCKHHEDDPGQEKGTSLPTSHRQTMPAPPPDPIPPPPAKGLMNAQLRAKPSQCNKNSTSPASTELNYQKETQARNALAWQANVQLTEDDLLAVGSPPRLKREQTTSKVEPTDLTWHWQVCCVAAPPLAMHTGCRTMLWPTCFTPAAIPLGSLRRPSNNHSIATQ